MEKYTLLNELGSGSYGAAHLALHNESLTKFVIKQIKLSHLNPSDLENAKKEVEVLSKLVHGHITRFEESFEKDGLLYIVMEYCASGDLQQLISSRKGIYFPENRILDWFTQLCLAVKFIHDKHIIHRDIKTQNIFLSEDGKIKLGDFGIAKMLEQTNDLANTCIGTPYYLSPEMCENKPYSNKTDVWAIGCVLHEMASLNHAFDAPNMKSLIIKIVKCSYKPIPPRYSRDFRNLVKSIFQRDTACRPSIKVVLHNKLLFTRVPKFITDADSPHLLAKPAPKKTVSAISKAKRISIHKQIGLSSPASKYGISPALKKYGLKSSKLTLKSSQTKTNKVNTPRNSSKISNKIPKKDDSLKDLNLKVSLRKKMQSLIASIGDESSMPKDSFSSQSKIRLTFESDSISSINLSKSRFNDMRNREISPYLSNSQKLLANVLSKHVLSNLTSTLRPVNSTDQQDSSKFNTATLKMELIAKMSDIVDQEVLQLSQVALEKRETSYSNAMTNFCQNSLPLCGASFLPGDRYVPPSQDTLFLNDINIKMSECGKTYIVSCSENLRGSFITTHLEPQKKHCCSSRSKWQMPQTPVFAKYPLESTASQMDSTSSTDIVIVYDNSSHWKDDDLEIYQEGLPKKEIEFSASHPDFHKVPNNEKQFSNKSFKNLILPQPCSTSLPNFPLCNKNCSPKLSSSLECLGNSLKGCISCNSNNKNIEGDFLVENDSNQENLDALSCVHQRPRSTYSEDQTEDNFHGLMLKSRLLPSTRNNSSAMLEEEQTLPLSKGDLLVEEPLTENNINETKIPPFTDLSSESSIRPNDEPFPPPSCNSISNASESLLPISSDSNSGNKSKKARRSFFRFFNKSSPNIDVFNNSLQNEENCSNLSPASKTKSRFSGIFKKFMSPKMSDTKESSFLTLADNYNSTQEEEIKKEPLTPNTTIDNDTNSQGKLPFIQESSPVLIYDSGIESGVHSCSSKVVSTSPEDSDSTLSSFTNTCIIGNLNIEKKADLTGSDVSSIEIPFVPDVRDVAYDVVQSVLSFATDRFEENSHRHLISSEDFNFPPGEFSPRCHPTMDKRKLIHKLEHEMCSDKDYNGNTVNIENDRRNSNGIAQLANKVISSKYSNDAAIFSNEKSSLGSPIIYTHVTPPQSKFTTNENNLNSPQPLILKKIPDMIPSVGDLYKNVPSPQDVISTSSESVPSEDIYGWIEAQKETLEQELGLKLFLECYRYIRSAFEEGDFNFKKAVEEIKLLMGSKKYHLVQDIANVIISESVYEF